MVLNQYKYMYGEVDGKFKISHNGKILFIPLWAERFLLRNIKSKKFRIQKKVLKKEFQSFSKKGGFVLTNFYLSK